MASEFPYFNFWVKDFLGDNHVMGMSAEEVGGYLLLLLAAWQESPVATLPNDDAILCRLARMGTDRWQDCRTLIRACFGVSRDGKRLVQTRLQREYRRLESLRKSRTEKARAAANARWLPERRLMLGAFAKQCSSNAPECHPDSDSEEEKKEEETGVPVSCPEPEVPASVPPAKVVLTFPVNPGKKGGATEWHLLAVKLAEYAETFPHLDVLAEIRKALQWVRDGPARRKTAGGMPRFLGGWLGRAQDRGQRYGDSNGNGNGNGNGSLPGRPGASVGSNSRIRTESGAYDAIDRKAIVCGPAPETDCSGDPPAASAAQG